MRAADDSGRRQTIEAALSVAAEEVAAHGWDGLQMQTVAARVGVSRQTLYNAFTNKHGLAQALVLRLTEQFLAGVEDALTRADDIVGQWRAAVLYTLKTAAADPLLKAVLTAESRDELLPLLTSDAGPVINVARQRLAGAILTARPDVDPATARHAAETATRLAISHIVLPLHPNEEAAALIATIVDRYIGTPTALGLTTRPSPAGRSGA
ncbi:MULTISPECIES: TetR/AcrR family transcriptional regulator [Pseudonocardia]|jgi:AcrR family transcriptional regulator|uniref:AcrR family transcriptional regulator n=1 Tax=Pseudonocardia alni TaxID=33907 RepID=A0A852WDD3_PSEA5|nr:MULTISPECIES: TetR family transcriptional regulator [Pseudonocardia]NYG05371.1 AcrR family transcriptional regulator [Pseudonocardia antarctica]PKB41397.1 TetR family transcriptional regulator [Pseudonocardia alni]